MKILILLSFAVVTLAIKVPTAWNDNEKDQIKTKQQIKQPTGIRLKASESENYHFKHKSKPSSYLRPLRNPPNHQRNNKRNYITPQNNRKHFQSITKQEPLSTGQVQPPLNGEELSENDWVPIVPKEYRTIQQPTSYKVLNLRPNLNKPKSPYVVSQKPNSKQPSYRYIPTQKLQNNVHVPIQKHENNVPALSIKQHSYLSKQKPTNNLQHQEVPEKNYRQSFYRPTNVLEKTMLYQPGSHYYNNYRDDKIHEPKVNEEIEELDEEERLPEEPEDVKIDYKEPEPDPEFAVAKENIPTRPIYPGEGKWAMRGIKHRPYVRLEATQRQHANEENEERPEGYEIFENGQKLFEKQANFFERNSGDFFDNAYRTIVPNQERSKSLKPVQTVQQQDMKKKENEEENEEEEEEEEEEQRKEDENEDHENLEEDSDEDEEDPFVPTKLYSQLRKHEDVHHLPISDADETRLREVVKDSKIQTVYTEEGYEDVSYDHGGHEKEAEIEETFGDVEKEIQKEKKEDQKAAGSRVKYSDSEPAGTTLSKRRPKSFMTNNNFMQTSNNMLTSVKDKGNGTMEMEIQSEVKVIMQPNNSTKSHKFVKIYPKIVKDMYKEPNENKEDQQIEKKPNNMKKKDHNAQKLIRKRRFTIDFPNIEVDTDFIDKINHEIPPTTEDYSKIKYPYYNLEGINENSPLRYSENLENIPIKTEGSMSFYDQADRKVKCEELPNIDPIPEKIKKGEIGKDNEEEEDDENRTIPPIPRGTPKLKGLGAKIDCFKAKYFGEHPLDSPFFGEELVGDVKPIFNFKFDDKINEITSKQEKEYNSHNLKYENINPEKSGLNFKDHYETSTEIIKENIKDPYYETATANIESKRPYYQLIPKIEKYNHKYYSSNFRAPTTEGYKHLETDDNNDENEEILHKNAENVEENTERKAEINTTPEYNEETTTDANKEEIEDEPKFEDYQEEFNKVDDPHLGDYEEEINDYYRTINEETEEPEDVEIVKNFTKNNLGFNILTDVIGAIKHTENYTSTPEIYSESKETTTPKIYVKEIFITTPEPEATTPKPEATTSEPKAKTPSPIKTISALVKTTLSPIRTTQTSPLPVTKEPVISILTTPSYTIDLKPKHIYDQIDLLEYLPLVNASSEDYETIVKNLPKENGNLKLVNDKKEVQIGINKVVENNTDLMDGKPKPKWEYESKSLEEEKKIDQENESRIMYEGDSKVQNYPSIQDSIRAQQNYLRHSPYEVFDINRFLPMNLNFGSDNIFARRMDVENENQTINEEESISRQSKELNLDNENSTAEELPETQEALIRRRNFRRRRPYNVFDVNRYIPRQSTQVPFYDDYVPTSTVLPKYKVVSEVFYKDEIKPNEQLNVFADIINNIKNSSKREEEEDSKIAYSDYSRPMSVKLNNQRLREINKRVKMPPRTLGQPLFENDYKKIEETAESSEEIQTSSSETPVLTRRRKKINRPKPVNEVFDEMTTIKANIDNIRSKFVPIKQKENFKNIMDIDDGVDSDIKQYYGGEINKIRFKRRRRPVATTTTTTEEPDVVENYSNDFKPSPNEDSFSEETTKSFIGLRPPNSHLYKTIPKVVEYPEYMNLYLVPGMRPPLKQKAKSYSDYILLTDNHIRRRVGKPVYRRHKRAANRPAYTGFSRNRGAQEEKLESVPVAKKDEEDDYVPHRPVNYHYDEKLGKIVYDKKPNAQEEEEEAEYEDIEEVTQKPKKNKPSTTTKKPLVFTTPKAGEGFLDFISKLKDNEKYVVLLDPTTTEAPTTQRIIVSTVKGVSSTPKFLNFLSKLHGNNKYKNIENPTDKKKPKVTTTTKTTEEEEEEEEEEEDDEEEIEAKKRVKNSRPNNFGIFDINDFIPKYQPKTSIDYSKYKTIERPVIRHNLSSRYNSEEDTKLDEVITNKVPIMLEKIDKEIPSVSESMQEDVEEEIEVPSSALSTTTSSSTTTTTTTTKAVTTKKISRRPTTTKGTTTTGAPTTTLASTIVARGKIRLRKRPSTTVRPTTKRNVEKITATTEKMVYHHEKPVRNYINKRRPIRIKTRTTTEKYLDEENDDTTKIIRRRSETESSIYHNENMRHSKFEPIYVPDPEPIESRIDSDIEDIETDTNVDTNADGNADRNSNVDAERDVDNNNRQSKIHTPEDFKNDTEVNFGKPGEISPRMIVSDIEVFNQFDKIMKHGGNYKHINEKEKKQEQNESKIIHRKKVIDTKNNVKITKVTSTSTTTERLTDVVPKPDPKLANKVNNLKEVELINEEDEDEAYNKSDEANDNSGEEYDYYDDEVIINFNKSDNNQKDNLETEKKESDNVKVNQKPVVIVKDPSKRLYYYAPV